jgi:hypothetical protein
VAVVGLLLAGNNSVLRTYDPVATASGEPRLGSFLAQPAAPAGWSVAWETEYTSNKPLFGPSSRWFRYIYSPNGGPSDLGSSLPVTADVINAGGLSGFGQFGVAACYTFHGYTLRDVATVNLGDGINGQTLSYAGANRSEDWSIVYWIWPVATAKGTRYERIILYLQNTELDNVRVGTDVQGISGLKGALVGTTAQDRRLIQNRAFLVEFAREIVKGQAKRTDTAVNIATFVPPGAVMQKGTTTAHYSSSPPNAAAVFQRLKLPVPAAVTLQQNWIHRGTLWDRLGVPSPSASPQPGAAPKRP